MPNSIRVAAFDIGTNTALCLVIEADRNGLAKVILDRHAIARLGEGVDQTRTITDPAFERFIDVMRGHLEAIKALSVDHIVAVGTSALRDAINREEVIRRAKSELGIDIRIISGHEEAKLTYRGALVGIECSEESTAVLDIGGGSTELAVGRDGQFANGESINIGAVRMTERYFSVAPPHPLTQARGDIASSLEAASRLLKKGIPLAAVAGTPTSLAGMDLRLQTFDAQRIQGHRLKKDVVERFVTELASTKLEVMMQRYPVIAKGRADILLAGSLILLETMHQLGLNEVTVSTRGLRYGVAISEIEQRLDLPSQPWLVTA